MGKIRFYLTGYKGYKVLENIINEFGVSVIKEVIIGSDKGVENDYYNEINNICKGKINVFKKHEKKVLINNYAIAIGWRWMINMKYVPKLIILHDSILPKYRGFNPLVTALINRDKEIGVSAFYAGEKFDDGDIIYISKSKINYPIKISQAIDIIINNYTEIIIKIINNLKMNTPLPKIKQNHNRSSYSLWRDEQDYHIDWTKNSKYIQRFVDAVGPPYAGAFTIYKDKKIRILEVNDYDDLLIENRCPGKIFFIENSKPIIVCGKGLLKISKMHLDKSSEPFILKKVRSRFI